jgi:hypothetical protein
MTIVTFICKGIHGLVSGLFYHTRVTTRIVAVGVYVDLTSVCQVFRDTIGRHPTAGPTNASHSGRNSIRGRSAVRCVSDISINVTGSCRITLAVLCHGCQLPSVPITQHHAIS